MKKSLGILATALIAAAPWVVAPVAAAPVSSSIGLQNAVESQVQTVQYRRWHRRGYYRGYGGLATGLIIGGAIARSYNYPYGYPYSYPYAAAPYPYPGGDAVGYCLRRFRSYDPASGTYLGYDGYRHPCP